MNKNIFAIIFSVILVVLAGAYFYLTGFHGNVQPVNTGLNISTSTDINNNSNNAITTSSSSVKTLSNYSGSPFGVFTAFSGNEFSYFNQRMNFSTSQYFDWAEAHLTDLGAHWTRSNTQLIWDMVEPEIGKGYVWDNIMLTDTLIKRIYDSKIEINWLGVFAEGAGKKGGRNPMDYPAEYSRYVQDVVERYDGDGVADASPKVKVKYWQIGNEVMIWTQSGRTADQYVAWLKLMNTAIKKADPEAKIVLIAPTSGISVDPFIQQVIEKTANQNLFDAVDIHHWGPAGAWAMKAVPDYRKLLDENGYKNVEIWSCEHGTWQGTPNSGSKDSPRYVSQTELQQAQFLVKSYVYNVGQGVSRIMWNNLVEWDKFNGSTDIMFNSMGLISDGQGPGEDPNMFNVPRLSYYSYKKMTEMLEGSDWKNIETIIESDNVYLYKFTNQNTKKEVYVGWYEGNGGTKDVSFNASGSNFLAAETIPNVGSGKDIVNYNPVFNKGSVKVLGGKVNMKLGYVPVYIEESNGNLAEYVPKDLSPIASSTPPVQTQLQQNQTQQKPGSDCVQSCIATGKQPQQCLQQCLGSQTPVSTSSKTGTNQAPPAGTNPSCGDGVCGPREKSGEIPCPADCK